MGAGFPESELVRRTFTLREMDLPPSVHLTRRSLLRWFALSAGLISEQESRSTLLEVLDALFYFQLQKKKDPTGAELCAYLKERHKKDVSEKLLRYHLNRMMDLNLVLRKQKKYFFNPSPYAEKYDFKSTFAYWVGKSVEKSLADLGRATEKLQKSYGK